MKFELTAQDLNDTQQKIINQFDCLLIFMNKPTAKITLGEIQYDELLKAVPEDLLNKNPDITLVYKGVPIVKL